MKLAFIVAHKNTDIDSIFFKPNEFFRVFFEYRDRNSKSKRTVNKNGNIRVRTFYNRTGEHYVNQYISYLASR